MAFDFVAARNLMVDTQVRPADVTDHAIQDAMRQVEREGFCPPDKRVLAYADAEIPYGGGRFLMRPREVGKLLQALRPRAGERALAIAAPYAAAVMQAMGLHVDRWDEADLASPPAAPAYHVILCEGAVSAAPPAWLALLEPGGRLGVVERNGPVGKAKVYMKSEHGLGTREVFDSTPPLLPGFEAKPQFAF